MSPEYCSHHHHHQLPCVRHTNTLYADRGGRWAAVSAGKGTNPGLGVDILNCRGQGLRNTGSGLCRIFLISLQGSWCTHLNFPAVPPPYPVPVLMLHVMAAMKPTVNRLLSRQRNTRPPRPLTDTADNTCGSFCSVEGGSDPNIGTGLSSSLGPPSAGRISTHGRSYF